MYPKSSSLDGNVRGSFRCIALLLSFLLALNISADGASLTWDASGSNPGSPTGGVGSWDTSSALWSNGTTDVAWSNGTTTAVIGANSTLTIATPISAGGISFPATGSGTYQIFGTDTLTLVGSAPVINAASGTNPQIYAPLSGTGGFTLTGGGTLSLSNTDPGLSGNLAILNGALEILVETASGPGNILIGDISGNSDATFILSDAPTLPAYTNNIIVQGGNSGTASILFSASSGINSTGMVTLGSANAAGTVVGHNLTVNYQTTYNAGAGLTGPIADPVGITGQPGIVTLLENNTNTLPDFFGNPNSTYSGGTIINLGAAPTNGYSSSIQFPTGTGSYLGTGAVTINSGSLSSSGSTTVTGSNSQTWNGDWSVVANSSLNFAMTGAIDLGNSPSGPTRTITVTGGTLSIAGAIQNGSNGTTSNLTKAGSGTMVLAGNNTYSGTTSIAAGMLQLGNGGTTGQLGTSSTIADNGTFAINRSNAVAQGTDFSGAPITGAGGFTQAGTGTTTLTATNTYTGPTSIVAGTLQVNGSLAASSAVSVGSAGTLTGSGTINGTVSLTGNGVVNLGNTGYIAGGINATGGTWSGSGTVSAVYSSSGTFTIAPGANLTSGPYVNDFYGGALAAGDDSSTITGSVSFGFVNDVGNGGMSPGNIFSGVIAGAGNTLTVEGGTVTLSGTNANTYTGLTYLYDSGELDLDKTGVIAVPGNLTIYGGGGQGQLHEVKLLASNQIATTSVVNINGYGELDLNGQSNTVASLTVDMGDIVSTIPGGNLTVTGACTFGVDGGNFIGAGATVTCDTTATVAALDLLGTIAGNVNVVGGLGGTGTVTGTVTSVDGGGIGLSLASPGTSETLTVGGLNLGSGTVTFNITYPPATSTEQIVDTGNLVLNGGTTININTNTNVAPTPGKYTLIATTGTLTGDLTDLTLNPTTLDGESFSLSLSGSSLVLTVIGPQTITFPAISGQPSVGSQVILGATATSSLPISYSIVSGPATIVPNSNIATITGVGTVVVQADQPGNSYYLPAQSVQQSFTTIKTVTFANWEAQNDYFNQAQMNDSSISGPTATPQNDGVPNLLKYLFNINPTVPMNANDRAALPVLGIANNGDLTLTYGQYAFYNGITIYVQTSTDLKNWTTLSSNQYTSQPTGETDPNGDPYTEIEVPFTNSPMFIRLDVTEP